MTTIAPPISFSATNPDLGYDYVFAAQQILMELQDSLPLVSMGTVPLVGDLAGSGSDVLRVTEMGNVGFSQRMAAIATEDGTITASSITTAYTEITIGQYGLAHEETFASQILGREKGVSLDALVAQVPNSWIATHRYLVCVEGATFGTIIGSATAALSVDDWIDLTNASNETLGSMAPSAVLAPQQVSQLTDSFRTEPAFQSLAASFAELKRVQGMQMRPNFAGLGVDIAMTDDVVQSGGAYLGFAMSPGGIGWARASTNSATPQGTTLLVPEFGLLIVRVNKDENAKARYEARAWMGVNSGSSNVFFQRRIRSVV
jgi:hypothetical protein